VHVGVLQVMQEHNEDAESTMLHTYQLL